MPTVDGIDLEVQAFLFCDSVVKDAQTGKSSVQGIFDNIFAAGFPAAHPQMTAFFRLQFDGEPRIQINAGLRITTPSGLRNDSPAMPVNFAPGTDRAEGWMTVQGFVFNEPGRYTFELLINYESVARYFVVAQRAGAQSSGSGRLLN